MKRTQLQLDEDTYQLLRARAYEEGTSIAALGREILRQHLGTSPRQLLRAEDFRFIAPGRSAESDMEPISERHDEALEQDFA